MHTSAAPREPKVSLIEHTFDTVQDWGADTATLRKARGAFFTPPALCRYVVEWAVRDGSERILEPSCGDAEFLLAAADRLDDLHAPRHDRLAGVEMHGTSAASAATRLADAGHQAEITTSDFFLLDPEPRYDVVIGNPPYIRYQDFSGEARARSREAALRAGVPLTGLASSWAAFTVHAALFLRQGGRIGLVLPAELLTVNYAAEVRRFLMARFASVRLVMFTERVFPGVLEEVVLLLAEGYDKGPADHCELYQVLNGDDLGKATGVGHLWTPNPTDGKWTPSLLSPDALKAFVALEDSDGFTTLDTWGDTTLGMVTGNNRYFALSPQRVRELGLAASDVIPLSPPGSRHLRGLTFTPAGAADLGAAGSATWLFRPPGGPSAAAQAYIDAGETTGVNKAYKCKVRKPWWRVPLVKPADLLLTYMNADTPRLCANRARAHHLNSVHGIYLKPGLTALGMDLLPLVSLNSMTLLGAETVGRAYGGGMLKIEPREADRLPVPSPDACRAAAGQLRLIRPQLARSLRSGKVTDAAKIVDEVLLIGELGMTHGQVRSLREAHAELTHRRTSRGAVPRGTG